MRFYEYQATTDKNLQSGLVIDSETASDAFGSSVSISGDGLAFAVGAIVNDGGGSNRWSCPSISCSATPNNDSDQMHD